MMDGVVGHAVAKDSHPGLVRICRGFGGLAILTGLVVCAGWALDIPRCAHSFPGFPR